MTLNRDALFELARFLAEQDCAQWLAEQRALKRKKSDDVPAPEPDHDA